MTNSKVKPRFDGKGDAWAAKHRLLGPTYYLHDIDAMFGHIVFGNNTGEKLFLEYIPDNYSNRTKTLRQFAVVALFDRKANLEVALRKQNNLSTALYLWICRIFAEHQPIAPRFFYVIGGQSPPWKMVEINIETGSFIDDGILIDGNQPNWKEIWQKLGLIELRNNLRSHIDPNGNF